MAIIQKQQSVRYTAEQMFDLVNDIESYPQFLSWCNKAEIIASNDIEVVGKLSLRFGPFAQSFTTKNQLDRPEKITISLLEGPFSSLEGCWLFQPGSAGQTMVKLNLSFEFIQNPLLANTFGAMLEKVGHELVSEFVKRAEQVYG